MKIALITDTHFGARGDSLLFFDYMMDFYNNVFFPTLEEKNITTVIHLGDIVDRRKFINFNILSRFKNEFIEKLQNMNIDSHFIVGNHDTYFKNTNRINAMTELLDFSHKNCPKVYSEITTLNFDGTDILFVPWINSENYSTSIDQIKESTAPYCMGHLELEGFDFLRGVECVDGMSTEIFSKFKKVFTGHFHHKSSKKNVYYLGNPYELTWSDYNDQRGFHIFDTKTGQVEFIENPYKMFYKINYNSSTNVNQDYSYISNKHLKVIVEEKGDPVKFDVFLDTIYKFNPADLSVVEDNEDYEGDELDSSEISEDTLTLLSKYIDNYEIDVDKDKLKGIMRELYSVALRGE